MKQALMNLAKDKFPDLSEPEQLLIACVAKGIPWNRQVNDKDKDNPANAEAWGDERTLRVELILWLLSDVEAGIHLTEKGIRY